MAFVRTFNDEYITVAEVREVEQLLQGRQMVELEFFRCRFSCEVLKRLLLVINGARCVEHFAFCFPHVTGGDPTEKLEKVFNDFFLLPGNSVAGSLRSLHLAGFRNLALTNSEGTLRLHPEMSEVTLERCGWVDPDTVRGLTRTARQVNIVDQYRSRVARVLLQNCCSSPRLEGVVLENVNLKAMSAEDYLPIMREWLTVTSDWSRSKHLQVLMEVIGTRSVLARFRIRWWRIPKGYRRIMMDWCIRRTDSLNEMTVKGENLSEFVRLARERREKLAKRVVEELFDCVELENTVRGFLGIRPIIRIR